MLTTGLLLHINFGPFASVEGIATASCESPDYTVLASMFGTNEDRVTNAAGHAVKAGFLGS